MKKKQYGIWVIYCPCGWQTAGKTRDDNPPEKCAACSQVPDPEPVLQYECYAEYRTDVTAVVMTIADLRSQRIWDHAEKHGLMVIQTSARRYAICEKDHASTVGYSEGGTRSFIRLKFLIERASYQEAMAYLKEHTPPLPSYLKI